jgi:hypothetical protein
VLILELALNHPYLQVTIGLYVTPLTTIGCELVDHDAGRDTGTTLRATWCIDQTAATTKPHLGEGGEGALIEASFRIGKQGDGHLSLQIAALMRCGDKKLQAFRKVCREFPHHLPLRDERLVEMPLPLMCLEGIAVLIQQG